MTDQKSISGNSTFDYIDETSVPFLWNFRFGKTVSKEESSDKQPEASKPSPPSSIDCDRWELRYFWPLSSPMPIIIPAFEPHMFDIRHYNLSLFKDLYYLTNNTDNNVKIRNGEILLKKRVDQRSSIDGFLKKIRKDVDFEKDINILNQKEILKIIETTKILKKNDMMPFELVNIIKESMVINLKQLSAKIEFSKLLVKNTEYLSFCIESEFFEVVEHLKNSLNFDYTPCSYIDFLKGLKK